ncbi:hypothetical protein CCYA_CCYA14G3848 [Cyanidiococcus yangmingshanensis]|nr:hypothetical protein CCYA_CCYA14G3848 [Cyanidiococcus yangmingshanensis]
MPATKHRRCNCHFCERLNQLLRRETKDVCGDVVRLAESDREHALKVLGDQSRSKQVHLQKLTRKPWMGSQLDFYAIIRSGSQTLEVTKKHDERHSGHQADAQVCLRVRAHIADEIRRQRTLLNAIKIRLEPAEYQSLLKFFELLLTRIWTELAGAMRDSAAT